jgi:hypothetical protein
MSDEAETGSDRCARYKIRSNRTKAIKGVVDRESEKNERGKDLNVQKHLEIII